MNTMHAQCKALNTIFSCPNPIACNMTALDPRNCIDAHINNILWSTEIRRRTILINDVLRLCPETSREAIHDTVFSIPSHFNAEFVLLKALFDKSKCFQAPAFTHYFPSESTTTNGIVNENKSSEETLFHSASNSPVLLDLNHLDGLDEAFINLQTSPTHQVQSGRNRNASATIEAFPSTSKHGCEPMQIIEDVPEPPRTRNIKSFSFHDDDTPKIVSDNQSSLDLIRTGLQGEQRQSLLLDLFDVTRPLTPTTTVMDPGPNKIPKARNTNLLKKNKRKTNESQHPLEAPKKTIIEIDGGKDYLAQNSNENGSVVAVRAGTSKASKPVEIDLIQSDPDDQPIIVEQCSAGGRQRDLVSHLSELFPDVQQTYLITLCKDLPFTAKYVDFFIDKLLSDNYPKVEEEPLDYDSQLETMRSVLPDADPEYLSAELYKMKNCGDFKEFMSDALEFKDYPKAVDTDRKKKLNAQIRQYTSDFVAQDFLKIIPEPEKYFSDEKFKAATIHYQNASYHPMMNFLRNHFNRISVKHIKHILDGSGTFMKCVDSLEKTKEGVLVTKRKRVSEDYVYSNDIPLLQMFAYVSHKEAIMEARKLMESVAIERKEEAIRKKEVNTCACCYDEEVMPDDSFTCPNGCLACKDCIKRSVEILFAENKLNFPCLTDCGASWSLDVLQACLTPKLFSKIAQRKQLEEVKAAGIEDLEICPFCDFAAIPAPDNKIFRCYNPECMKESCRECKQPSHIPFRCDEVEQDSDVKQRKYIEDQMTEALLRKCWKCNLKFIKSDGCNKIICECGASMCYICNIPVDNYNHFNGQGANHPGRCPLYSNTKLEHEMAAIEGGKQAKKELGVTSMKVDPLADADERLKLAKKANPQNMN